MDCKKERKGLAHTKPDHRPMLPEFRKPEEPVHAAIRERIRLDSLLDVIDYLKWR